MKLSDLPTEIQQELVNSRAELHKKWFINDAYNVVLANKEGTRYFEARRVQSAYTDDRGNYMPFGGGSSWQIRYGKIKWNRDKDPVGCWKYFWQKTGEVFGKSANGTVIPKRLSKKSEVLDLVKNIGIFEI